MAMFPNATNGCMPYLNGKQHSLKHKRSKSGVKSGARLPKSENKHSDSQKMYQITLKDKNGKTYKYIVKTDSSKSLPNLGEPKVNVLAAASSLPNLGVQIQSPNEKCRPLLAKSDSEVNRELTTASLDLRECGKREGLISSIIRFIKQKTGKEKKSGKSKRKPKEPVKCKRQRTVSAMSNLDPIQESPNEHEYENDEDVDSYTHECSLSSDSDTSSVDSSMTGNDVTETGES